MANRVPMLDANNKVPNRFLSLNNAPAGMVAPWSGTGTVPGGWLLADGSAVSRAFYADLYAAIGTAYGAGDGSTTFNLPNLKGKVPVGQDATQTEFDTLGEVGGAKTVTLTEAQIPAHKHNINAGYTTNNTHSHQGSTSVSEAPYPTEGPSGSATAAILPTGGGGAHNNLQPYITLKYIISIGGGGTGLGSKGIVGEIIAWPQDSSPPDFLICQGQAISRSTYSDLFTVLGTTYGAGDGSTTFNIPNLMGRMVMGKDPASPFAGTGGESTHVLSAAEMPTHKHELLGGIVTPSPLSGSITTQLPSGATYGYNYLTAPALAAMGTAGSGAAHNNMPPYIAIHYAIRYRTTVGANDTNIAVADTTTVDMTLTGDGTKVNPYTVKADVLKIPTGTVTSVDTATVDMTLSGTGTTADPLTIKADVVKVPSFVGTYLTNERTAAYTAPTSTDTAYTGEGILLPPGVWMVQAGCSISTNVADTVSCAINWGDTLNILPSSTGVGGISNGTAGWPAAVVSRLVTVVPAVTTRVSAVSRRNGGSATTINSTAQGPAAWITATRIA